MYLIFTSCHINEQVLVCNFVCLLWTDFHILFSFTLLIYLFIAFCLQIFWLYKNHHIQKKIVIGNLNHRKFYSLLSINTENYMLLYFWKRHIFKNIILNIHWQETVLSNVWFIYPKKTKQQVLHMSNQYLSVDISL